MKKLLSVLMVLLLSCGKPSSPSQLQDHVVVNEQGEYFLVYENQETKQLNLARCNLKDMVELEQLYINFDQQSDIQKRMIWLLSKENLCHQPVEHSISLDKEAYLDILFTTVEINQNGERKLLQTLEVAVSELEKTISNMQQEDRAFKGKIAEHLETISHLTNQVVPDLQESVVNSQAMILYLEKKVADALNNEVSEQQISILKRQLQENQIRLEELQAFLTETQQNILSLQQDAEVNIPVQLEELKQKMQFVKDKVSYLYDHHKVDLQALKDQRIAVSEKLDIATFDLLNFNSTILLQTFANAFLEGEVSQKCQSMKQVTPGRQSFEFKSEGGVRAATGGWSTGSLYIGNNDTIDEMRIELKGGLSASNMRAEFVLTSPNGTKINLGSAHAGGRRYSDFSKTYRVSGVQGERLRGTWKVRVYAYGGYPMDRDTGSIYSWVLKVKSKSWIPDGQGVLVRKTTVNQQGFLSPHFKVDLDLVHADTSELQVFLIAPSGRELLLHDQTPGEGITKTYSYATSPDRHFEDYLGEPWQGEWQLKVKDLKSGHKGYVMDWSMRDQWCEL